MRWTTKESGEGDIELETEGGQAEFEVRLGYRTSGGEKEGAEGVIEVIKGPLEGTSSPLSIPLLSFRSFSTKLSFRFGGLITLFHCSIPVQGSQVIITPEKL